MYVDKWTYEKYINKLNYSTDIGKVVNKSKKF